MDAKLYAASVEYEKLTQAVYQAILAKEGVKGIDVEHDLNIAGKSGVEHQVDVSWRFRQATVEHHVLVECKSYSSAITLEKIRNLYAVLQDIGNCRGLIVTKTGFQSGVVKFAEYYGIGLKLLRAPTDEDWEGRVKDITVKIHAIALATSPDKCPKVTAILGLETQKELDLLNQEMADGKYTMTEGPDLVFVDSSGVPITEELRWWLPQQLKGDGCGEGGPYEKKIKLEGHFLELRASDGDSRCVKVRGVKVVYYYETIDTREFTNAGAEIVDSILKDFSSGEIEHVHQNKG